MRCGQGRANAVLGILWVATVALLVLTVRWCAGH